MVSPKLARITFIFCILYFTFFISSCSLQKQISRAAKQVVSDPSLQTAYTGISIYEPETGTYWYNYNGDKYFVPASNTKIPTCYAAMKYLGDSLVGLKWQDFSDTAINIFATGDPTFLHDDFKSFPVLEFLKKEKRTIYLSSGWQENALGSGWSWNDYNSYYMAERSPLPVYGNITRVRLKEYDYRLDTNGRHTIIPRWEIRPVYFQQYIDSFYILPLKITGGRDLADTVNEKRQLQRFSVERELAGNKLILNEGSSPFSEAEIPFYTDGLNTAAGILRKDKGLEKIKPGRLVDNRLYGTIPDHLEIRKIYSRQTDALLQSMMHRSDNFFAEQALLMVSDEMLGVMSDEQIIDTLLKTDFRDLPQKPRWVDGSGLSRYNLFSPQDFVFILDKIKNEFGMERVKIIFPTGGEGTLRNYYRADSNYIYAKTGSLSGVLALSGYLYTKKGKLLIFSTLVNNHRASASDIRKAMEQFLQEIRNRY